jgi:hypothetical protein
VRGCGEKTVRPSERLCGLLAQIQEVDHDEVSCLAVREVAILAEDPGHGLSEDIWDGRFLEEREEVLHGVGPQLIVKAFSFASLWEDR